MKNVVIIRDRGQLTIPDNIRKIVNWAHASSAVSISVVKPDEIVIRPHQIRVQTDEIWKKIRQARSIKGKGKSNTAEFLINDRQR